MRVHSWRVFRKRAANSRVQNCTSQGTIAHCAARRSHKTDDLASFPGETRLEMSPPCKSRDDRPIIVRIEPGILRFSPLIFSKQRAMNDNSQETARPLPLNDDLPPVQPPSAGFIVQLFVFPALIVMAVIAIWWMFGLIAAGEQDWHNLLQELQSQNSHIREKAMYGLAQVLEQDARRGDQGHHLNANREIAQVLADQLMSELRRSATDEKGVALQIFLTRAMGHLDAIDVTSPALVMAMEPQRDVDIRKFAVVSLSYVADRAIQHNEPLKTPELIEALVQLSADPLPVLRQSSAFALGLFDTPESLHQLEVLLENPDLMTRVNAAIGLARHDSINGFRVLRDSLKVDTLKFDDPPAGPKVPDGLIPKMTDAQKEETHEGEKVLILRNVLKAITNLAKHFEPEQRQELLPLLTDLSNNHSEIRIRIDATAAIEALKSAGNG